MNFSWCVIDLEHMLLARINLKRTVGMKTECNYSLSKVQKASYLI